MKKASYGNHFRVHRCILHGPLIFNAEINVVYLLLIF